MKRSTTSSAKIAASLLLSLTFFATSCIPTGGAKTSFDLLNQERSARGLHELTWDQDAANKAQEWAEYMAASRAIGHSTLTANIHGNWTYLGENVGYASTSSRVHNGFMNSSSHRGAILASKYDSVGIGVAVNNGVIYVAQVFRG